MNLLNCPFCGGAAQTDFIEGASYIIECYVCNAHTGFMDSAQEAVEAWNRRTPVSGEVASVPAQTGIDHAKLTEVPKPGIFDEHMAFCDWVNSHHEEARNHLTPWNAWQARGQQAGEAEDEEKGR